MPVILDVKVVVGCVPGSTKMLSAMYCEDAFAKHDPYVNVSVVRLR